MGLFDRFRGAGMQRPIAPDPAQSADDQAIARYRYMLRTAPPETIEQAHAEAFTQLTPEQRRRVLDELAREIPEAERAAAERAGASPGELARVATRAEIRQPGVMERVFGAVGAGSAAGPGFGSLLAGSFFASMAGTVIGSMIGQHFFETHSGAAHFVDHGGDPGALSRDYSDIGDVGGDVDTSGDFADFDGGGDTFDI